MHILCVSRHVFDGSSEGICAGKAAAALVAAGHQVTLVTDEREMVGAESLPPRWAEVELVRVPPDPQLVSRSWAVVEKAAVRRPLLRPFATLANLWFGFRVEEAAWILPVAATLRRLVRSRNYDVVFSRLNPPASHFAVLRAALPLGTAWCALFNDPWPHHRFPPPFHCSDGAPTRARLDHFLRLFLERSGSSVFPSDRLRNHMLHSSPQRIQRRSFVVPHLGTWWRPAPNRSAGGGLLRIRHAGFLINERRVEALFGALAGLLRERPTARERIRLEMVGRYSGQGRPRPPEELHGVVEVGTMLTPAQAQEFLEQAEALLLIEPDCQEGIFFPSKLADYLSAGRPILALSPARGVAGDLLGATGLVAPPLDEAAILAALRRLDDAWLNGDLESLRPPAAAVHSVTPSFVVPALEAAFEQARNVARGTP